MSGRQEVGYEDRIVLDQRYVQTRSIWLDLQILFFTVLVVTSLHRPFSFAQIRGLIAGFDRANVLEGTAFADELEGEADPLSPR